MTVAERDQIDALARDLNREFFPADPETARPRTAADELRYALKAMMYQNNADQRQRELAGRLSKLISY